MKINEASLRDAAIAYMTAADATQCHIHLRIDGEGNAYTSVDSGYCIGAAEFNREAGAAKTVSHSQGNGQNNLTEDWWHDEMDSVQGFVDAIYEDLQREGIKVEEVST